MTRAPAAADDHHHQHHLSSLAFLTFLVARDMRVNTGVTHRARRRGCCDGYDDTDDNKHHLASL